MSVTKRFFRRPPGSPGTGTPLPEGAAAPDGEIAYRQLAELSLDLLCVAGTDGYFKRVNPAFTRTLGWSEAELLSRPFLDLVHAEDLPATLREVEHLAAGGTTLHFENRYLCKDGSWRWLAWKTASGPGGVLYATARDTTRDREKEEEIRAVVSNLADCLVTIDAKGTVRSANPALERLLGYRSDEIIGRNVSMLMPEPHRSGHDSYLARYLRTGEARMIGIGREIEGLHKDGRRIPLELSVSEYVVRGERLFLGLLRDISERKRFIAELTEARADAEQASRAKSAFLATMSHEIRTPMNGVIGMVELLAHGNLSEHQADLVKTIRESAATLLDLIDDILDFSKIEAGRLVIERAPVALANVVEGLCSSLVAVANRRSVDMSLFVSPEIPERVLADEVRLRQVLYNLVGNAIKFCAGQPGRRGRVSIRVVATAAPPRLLFTVEDNGVGMAPETLKGLFSPFTQAEVSTTRRFGGTGLGLAICRRLVDLMDGRIEVESAPGEGTTFAVSVPLEIAPGALKRRTAILDGVDCIVVAGEGTRADDFRAYLEHAGARVFMAAGHAEAARQAARLEAPVVLQDVGHRPATPDTVRAAFGAAPQARHLLIRRGRRRRARVECPDVVTLDGDALRRESLLRAVAIAVGRASPELAAMPLPDREGREDVKPPSVEEARAQGRLILVAEDDDTNRKVIAKQLALLGYAAEIASNGREALRLWRGGDYALLITDLHMPEMDGYTLAEMIRREEGGNRRMPILALTANALRGEANRVHAVGMDEHLTKPVQLRLLRAALETWLARAPGPVEEGAARGVSRRALLERVVDVSVLEGLVGDDAATVREFLAEYLASARRLAKALRAAFIAGDAAAVGEVVHRLRSSSRSVGAIALGDVCARMEEAARNRDHEAIAEEVAGFESAWGMAEDEIENLLANP